MPIGTGLAIGLGVASAAGGIAGGAISSHAAGKAADTQAAAADRAAQLQYQASQDALNFQKQQYATSQKELAPWYGVGEAGLVNLSNLLGLDVPNLPAGMPTGATGTQLPATPGTATGARPGGPLQAIPANTGAQRYDLGMHPTNRALTGEGAPAGTASTLPGVRPMPGGPAAPGTIPGKAGAGPATPANLSSLINPSLGAKGSLLAPWTEKFQAPTDVTEQNDPGFKFRLQQGTDVLQRSAAAKGNLLTGGTAQDLAKFGQDYASNEYGNVYGRAYNDYTTRYNTFKQNQNDIFNRLAAISGVGQTTAGQLASGGQNFANNASSILMTGAGQIGDQYNNAAAARASGYVGAGNAWGSALGSGTNDITQMLLLRNLYGGGGGTANPPSGGR